MLPRFVKEPRILDDISQMAAQDGEEMQIVLAESSQMAALQVQGTDDPVASFQWYTDLGARIGITGTVVFALAHVVQEKRLPGLDHPAWDAYTDRPANQLWPARKSGPGAYDQFVRLRFHEQDSGVVRVHRILQSGQSAVEDFIKADRGSCGDSHIGENTQFRCPPARFLIQPSVFYGDGSMIGQSREKRYIA